MDLIIELTININVAQQQTFKIYIDSEKKEVRCVNDNSKEKTATALSPSIHTQSFQDFMQLLVKEKMKNGRQRTAETYQTTLNNINRFLKGNTLLFKDWF